MHFIYAFLTSIFLTAQVTTIPYDKVESGFKANNAKEIVELGKEKLFVNILGEEGAYSQSHAKLVLSNFFKKHKGNSFVFTFKGKESSEGSFGVGEYKTIDKEMFRVTVHFKKMGKLNKIESLSIEKG